MASDEAKTLDNDMLIDLFMDLFREYRNNGKLPEYERQRFHEVSAEIRRRGLLRLSSRELAEDG